MWILFASLHRLLPVVELHKGFKYFFDNPVPVNSEERRNLKRWQVGSFIVIALAGWLLGFILLAAMGGLIPKG